MQAEVSKLSGLKVKVVVLAAIIAGLISGVTAPASALLPDSGGSGGSFARLDAETCALVPAQIRGLVKTSCF